MTLAPVNVGVTLSLPPVPPTLPFAATVPMTVRPLRPDTSVQPAGQVPVSMKTIPPGNTVFGDQPSCVHVFGLVQICNVASLLRTTSAEGVHVDGNAVTTDMTWPGV